MRQQAALSSTLATRPLALDARFPPKGSWCTNAESHRIASHRIFQCEPRRRRRTAENEERHKQLRPRKTRPRLRSQVSAYQKSFQDVCTHVPEQHFYAIRAPLNCHTRRPACPALNILYIPPWTPPPPLPSSLHLLRAPHPKNSDSAPVHQRARNHQCIVNT